MSLPTAQLPAYGSISNGSTSSKRNILLPCDSRDESVCDYVTCSEQATEANPCVNYGQSQIWFVYLIQFSYCRARNRNVITIERIWVGALHMYVTLDGHRLQFFPSKSSTDSGYFRL